MAISDIRPRQDQIREWWLINRTSPHYLALASATWNRTADMVALERWIDMQARVACFEEGSILANDAKWKIIEEQLTYPPLWLVKNWNPANARKHSKGMLARYYVVQRETDATKYVLKPETRITENIVANSAELYEWLGITGGHRTVPPTS